VEDKAKHEQQEAKVAKKYIKSINRRNDKQISAISFKSQDNNNGRISGVHYRPVREGDY